MYRTALVFFITVSWLATAGSVQANLLLNGSFENGSGAPSIGVDVFLPNNIQGSSQLTSWGISDSSGSDPSLSWRDFGSFAYSGSRVVDLSYFKGGSFPKIFQTFDSVDASNFAPSPYRLDFALANWTSPTSTLRVEVWSSNTFVNNANLISSQNFTKSQSSSWSLRSLYFNAVSGSTTLRFYAIPPIGQADYGDGGAVLLDGVTVTAIPEVTNIAAWASGIAVFGLVALRRRGRSLYRISS